MDQYQLEVEEEILRLRRKFEVEIEGLNRKLLDTERQLRESFDVQRQLEFANNTLLTEIGGLEKDKVRGRE